MAEFVDVDAIALDSSELSQCVSKPRPGACVHKGECAYCFDTPLSAGGLLVCCKCHLALCPRCAREVHMLATATPSQHAHSVYLQIEQHRVFLPPEADAPAATTLTELAQRNAESQRYRTDTVYHVVRLDASGAPSQRVRCVAEEDFPAPAEGGSHRTHWAVPGAPGAVSECVDAMISADS